MKQRKPKQVNKTALINELMKLIFRELESGRSKDKSFAIIRKRWLFVEEQTGEILYDIIATKSPEHLAETGTAYAFSRSTFFKDKS